MIAGALAELRAKYEEMLALRLIASRAADAAYDPRARMVALAARFPGSLREIDELPIAEIEARIDALSRAERDPSATARWMHAMTRFHALTRGILFAKRARRDDEWPEEALVWRDEPRVAKPPSGRLTDLVYERLARELDMTPHEAKALVFGERAL
jgi:hypothetical protein